MKCSNHLDNEAVAVCIHCGKSICPDCQVIVQNENYCKNCVAAKIGSGAKTAEHSPALAAILSFIISGLGQIYNGQVGKGILIFFTGWLIIPWVIGIFDAYNVAKRIKSGELAVKGKPGCVIGFVIGVVAFSFGIFFIALLAAIAIPNLLRARLQANESAAQSVVQTIATAVEGYKAAHNGAYPTKEDDLGGYLAKSYDNQNVYGYTFREEFLANGYKIIAVPKSCGVTGTKVFLLENGGAVTSTDCQKE